MRRALVVILAAALLVPAAGSEVGAKKKAKRIERKMELPYTEPALGTFGVGLCFQGSSCLFYGAPAPKERFFSVTIKDDLGQPVYASVIQDTNEDGSYLRPDDLVVDICGETTEPIEIEPGKEISVWVWQGPGPNPPCPGGASAGKATAVFSNLP